MNVIVSYPDTNFPPISVSINEHATIEYVIEEARSEWCIGDGLEVTFEGDILKENSKVIACGISDGGNLIVNYKGYLVGKDELIHKESAIELHFRKHPDATLLVDASSISVDGACACGALPISAKRVKFINGEKVVRLEDHFLAMAAVTSLDLSTFTNLTEIGNYFLFSCSSLKSLDTTFLRSVTVIKGSFLQSSRFTEFNTIHMQNVTSIGHSFLSNTRLTDIDLSGLRNVTAVGSSFLRFSKFLESIDVSPLSKLTQIRESFLEFCPVLKTVKMSFPNVCLIEDGFMQDNRELQDIDLSSLVQLRVIPCSFLRDCSSLTAVDLSSLTNVVRVERCFLRGCSSLTEIDLSPLTPKVRAVGRNFLRGTSDSITVLQKEKFYEIARSNRCSQFPWLTSS
eukprot:TRINITY_DN22777_c0_g1_i1.p1 TRINITY_DN22777_c0_g1~~TRINITY_DN22777_c0_g1_i1.p1  ORF type:complete len:398 (+),score=45.95 TRINITY_DN22777_c0_g1_i1:40-1233(+)